MKNRIKVKAPATVSNLNCGFDILGVAIDVINDEIIGGRTSTPGVHIRCVGEHARSLPEDPDHNTAGVAVQHFLRFIGAHQEGIELEIHKKMRPGSGLGSSASSACAAVVLANELFRRPLTRRELLPFAILGEHAADQSFHADNVAPCLLGGMVLIRDLLELDVHRVYLPEGLFMAVAYPEIRILTADARGVLSPTIDLRQMVIQSANLGALLLGLQRSDLQLVSRSLQDVIIEPQRKQLIPGFDRVTAAALAQGALGCGISGAGPTVFALCQSRNEGELCAAAMQKAFAEQGLASEVFCAGISSEGTTLC
ncbi:MAG: homoserine kinase [Saprospiraceae bacterium]|nr:homoserine kinase [Saprospiraceae bacterium]